MATKAVKVKARPGGQGVAVVETSRRPKRKKVVRVDVFREHWLVDSPRAILTEATRMGQASIMSQLLDEFYEEVAVIEEKQARRAKTKCKEVMEYVFPRAYKLATKVGLKLRKYIFTGSNNDDTQVVNPFNNDVFLLFESHTAKVEMLKPGYYHIPLSRHRQIDGDKPDKWRWGRSEDGTYLSSLVVEFNIYSVIQRAIQMHAHLQIEPWHPEKDGSRICLLLKNKYRVNVIPAFYLPAEGVHLTTRPYAYDDYPESDIYWRVSHADMERDIMHRMDVADRGIRQKTLKIWKALLRVEHTLTGLTSYHVKTILLHAMDDAVDNTPRWQREELESCFLSVLKALHNCLSEGNLQHFYVSGHNLFANMPERVLANLRARVAYIMVNPKDVCRILKKRVPVWATIT